MKFLRILAWTLVCGALFSAPAAASLERPPQFVVISFDNCGELERWQELSDFLDETGKAGERVRFTFFVSGTNFLPDAKRHRYRAPHQAPGASNIGFGGSPGDVARRIDFINRLYASGNEIASHAVGHFDGKAWSPGDWGYELQSYAELLRGADEDGAKFSLAPGTVRGFRAPYLGRGPALFAALNTAGFRYDASGVGNAGEWPQKIDGLWRFNLAQLRIAGSGRPTLSMDYNFLVAQSGPAGNPKLQHVFREEMLRTYLDYFRSNYAGNRAPIHIGHHFSPMQGGVYNQALLTFARTVCSLPEVRCTTYKELADYLDAAGPAALQAYQRGSFPRAARPLADLDELTLRGTL